MGSLMEAPAHKFCVGDRVRIVGGGHRTMAGRWLGCEATVTRVSPEVIHVEPAPGIDVLLFNEEAEPIHGPASR